MSAFEVANQFIELLSEHGPTQFYRRMQMLLHREGRLASQCSNGWRATVLTAASLVVGLAALVAGVRPVIAQVSATEPPPTTAAAEPPASHDLPQHGSADVAPPVAPPVAPSAAQEPAVNSAADPRLSEGTAPPNSALATPRATSKRSVHSSSVKTVRGLPRNNVEPAETSRPETSRHPTDLAVKRDGLMKQIERLQRQLAELEQQAAGVPPTSETDVVVPLAKEGVKAVHSTSAPPTSGDEPSIPAAASQKRKANMTAQGQMTSINPLATLKRTQDGTRSADVSGLNLDVIQLATTCLDARTNLELARARQQQSTNVAGHAEIAAVEVRAAERKLQLLLDIAKAARQAAAAELETREKLWRVGAAPASDVTTARSNLAILDLIWRSVHDADTDGSKKPMPPTTGKTVESPIAPAR